MQIIYLLIVVLPIVAEFSNGICTDGVMRKLSLGLLSLGGLIALSGHGENFMCVAIVFLYLEKLIYCAKQKYKQH